MFSPLIGNGGFKPCKNIVLDRSWKWMILPNKRRTNLETTLLEVRHMSGLKFFYFGLPISVSKPEFLNTCGLHMDEEPLHSTGYSHLSVEDYAKTLVRSVLARESPRKNKKDALDFHQFTSGFELGTLWHHRTSGPSPFGVYGWGIWQHQRNPHCAPIHGPQQKPIPRGPVMHHLSQGPL